MIAYICNKCKKPIDPNDERCVHFQVSWAWKAVESKGKYGSCYDGDLCGDCYNKISKQIDFPYYGGGNFAEIMEPQGVEVEE